MAKVDKLIEHSKEHLNADEKIAGVVMGAYETKLLGNSTVRNGIFLATNRRIVFYAKKMFGFDLESLPYENISSIEMSKGLMGHVITLLSSGNKASMKWINDHNSRESDISGFVEFVRNNMGKNHSVANISSEPDNIPDQIKKLAELKNQGILTDEELSSKKQELLAKL